MTHRSALACVYAVRLARGRTVLVCGCLGVVGVWVCWRVGWRGVIDFAYYRYGVFDSASVQLKFERMAFTILWLVFMLLD